MISSRRRNDRSAPPSGGGDPRGRPHHGRRGGAAEEGWLWGTHAVHAALANPERRLLRLVATAERAHDLGDLLAARADAEVRVEPADNGEIAQLLPPGASHQGVALRAEPLPDLDVDDVAQPAHGLILLLDGVTDPQNVGAILRSAEAFGARAVILQDRHAPKLAGAAAKAAAGAVERLPVARVVNLSRALDRLADLGWRAVGLAGEAQLELAQALDGGPTVLVLGSEGEGLRRLVAEHCEALARIPMAGGAESLNVSAAAAVALYAAAGAARARGEAA
ncbi:MAG: 23S rRNA (guanosine(2251)-2'-O)-methyltransferase RlmB [Caulobacteraceae bacterium]|nr:23S rRNA (guanosine(2251)-2'-O)-methyltransferase RlmB [Caulobacter sp.]